MGTFFLCKRLCGLRRLYVKASVCKMCCVLKLCVCRLLCVKALVCTSFVCKGFSV